jgi:hypothetical protein
MEPDKNPIYFGLKPAPGPTRQYSARNRSDPTVFSPQPTRPGNVEPAPVRGSDRVGLQDSIAHRGTVFNVSNASLLADYDLFILMNPQQFVVAQEFTDKIPRQMDRKRILWHTGHSLGGAIAEFLVANETLFKQHSLSFAVTFDSPGIMEILEEYHHRSKIEQSLPRSDEFPVICYLSVPNIVNTMGTHISLVLRLSPAPP